MEDLPKGVALEVNSLNAIVFIFKWRKWSLNDKYMCFDPKVQKLYDEVKFPILSYGFTDDV